MTPSTQGTTRLRAELDAHGQAMREVIASAESLDPSSWNLRKQGGKWSPAQVVEHLRLSYATVRAELCGQGGFRIRTKWWQQHLLRMLFLPKILKSGRFPKGVRATSEIRPGSGPFDRQQLLDALRHEGEQFMKATDSPFLDRGSITHPFLGKIGLADGVRFMTQHLRHHHAQIVVRAPDA